MLVMRRLSRSHARQASHSMQPWLKRIALGVFLAALFIVQFVPGKESSGKESSGKEIPGTESLGKENPGTESPGTESPGTAHPAKDRLNKGRSVPTPYANSP